MLMFVVEVISGFDLDESNQTGVYFRKYCKHTLFKSSSFDFVPHLFSNLWQYDEIV